MRNKLPFSEIYLRDIFSDSIFWMLFDTYVFCLSEHDRANTDGLLSMWRGYGQHGNGSAIVFDAGAVTLAPTSPLIISKVSYASDRDRTTQLEERLEQWASLAQQARLPNEKLFLVAHARSRRRLEDGRSVSQARDQRGKFLNKADLEKLLRANLGSDDARAIR